MKTEIKRCSIWWNVSRQIRGFRVPCIFHFIIFKSNYSFHNFCMASRKISSQCHVRKTKVQISLRINASWSESWYCAPLIDQWSKMTQAASKVSDQTVSMGKLVRVFAGHVCHKPFFARCGPDVIHNLYRWQTCFLVKVTRNMHCFTDLSGICFWRPTVYG